MTSGERGTNVTMIAEINAGGGFIPPMLIFPRVNFRDHMLKGATPDELEVLPHQDGLMKTCFTNSCNTLSSFMVPV